MALAFEKVSPLYRLYLYLFPLPPGPGKDITKSNTVMRLSGGKCLGLLVVSLFKKNLG